MFSWLKIKATKKEKEIIECIETLEKEIKCLKNMDSCLFNTKLHSDYPPDFGLSRELRIEHYDIVALIKIRKREVKKLKKKLRRYQ